MPVRFRVRRCGAAGPRRRDGAEPGGPGCACACACARSLPGGPCAARAGRPQAGRAPVGGPGRGCSRFWGVSGEGERGELCAAERRLIKTEGAQLRG